MAGLTDTPLYPPSEWDQLVIGGEALPGLAIVRARSSVRIDSKKAAGGNGASPTLLGRNPVDVDITLQVRVQELNELLKRLDPFWPRKPLTPTAAEKRTQTAGLRGLSTQDKARRKAEAALRAADNPFNVYHPALHVHCVGSIFLLDRVAPEKGPATGAFTMTLKAQEFRLPDANKQQSSVKTFKSSYGNIFTPIGGQSVQPKTQSLPSDDPKFTGPR